MKKKLILLIKVLFTVILISGALISISCAPEATAAPEISQSPPVKTDPVQPPAHSPAGPPEIENEPPPATTVTVTIAGFINHGPMQPTIRAIKDVLTKYEDNVEVTWVDLGTQDGVTYFKENGLTAHMNVIINGTTEYTVNGKDVEFQWFEGSQWTKQDLDKVLSDLINK